MANNNYGIWALAINLLLLPIFKSILLWYFSDWSPKLVFSISSLKRHLSFGSRLLIIGVFDKIVSNFESLLIGKYYSKIELGYFSQARKLNSYVVETSSIVLQRVTYPLLSKLGDNKAELKNGYRKVIEVSMFVIFPTMFFIYISSENIIISLFGEKWLDSAKYLRLWSICGLVITLYSFFINIFLVLSKTNLLLIISIIRQVLRLVMLFFVLKMDVISILYGITIVTIISGIIYIYIGGKFINYTFKEVFFDIKYILIFSILSSIITYFIGKYFILESNTLKLFIQIFSMTFMYFSLSMIFNSKPLLEVKFLLSNILGKK
ncbi:oligosaccharide flippase family protein [Algoriphagus halophilus]